MRQWVYETLRDDVTLQGLVAKVGASESFTSADIPKPFIVYTVGNATNEDIGGEDDKQPQRQFFQIYVHDVPADYAKIDAAIKRIKALLTNKGSKLYKVIMVRYLETSRDLDDETMGTIVRYIRFQAIMEE